MNARQLLSIEDRIFSQLQRLKALAATDPALVPVYVPLVESWSGLRRLASERAQSLDGLKDAAQRGKELSP